MSWLATAQGGVPNVRGHGGWIRPATSMEDVARACIASTSARKTPGVGHLRAVRRVAASPGRRPGRPPRRSAGPAAGGRRGSQPRSAGSRSRISAYASSAPHRSAPEVDRVPDHLALRAHQRPAAADQHQRRLAVLAQVAGEPPPERHERVLGDAVGRLQQALALARRHDLLGEDPLGDEERGGRRGRAAARRTGRCGRCRRPARVPGLRCREYGSRRARRRAATSPGGPSRSARRWRPR